MEIRNLDNPVTAAENAQQLKHPASSADKNRQAAKKVAREFESLMVNEMLKSMRATTGKDPLISGGRGEEIYQSLLDQEYAQAIAGQGMLGLAKIIEQQLAQAEKPAVARPATERRD